MTSVMKIQLMLVCHVHFAVKIPHIVTVMQLLDVLNVAMMKNTVLVHHALNVEGLHLGVLVDF